LFLGKARGGFSGLKPIKVKLFSVQQTNSSGAATPLAFITNIMLNTTTFPELSAFNQIYDEIRMMHVKIHYFPYVSTASSAVNPPTAIYAGALQFDPNAATPASPNGQLEESYNTGLWFLTPGVNGTLGQSSHFHLRFRTLSGKVPKIAPITGVDLPGSNWIVLNSGTAPTMAAWSGYATALGTAGITSVLWFVELDVELRLRT